MKTYYVIIYLLFTSLIFSSKIDIAVIEFECNGVSKSQGNALTDRLRAELVQIEEYNVLDREDVNKILTEQKFQASGCISEKCIIELGNMIGAKHIIGGSISKIGAYYSIYSKIVDVETGKIIMVATYDSHESIDDLLVFGMSEIASKLSNKPILESKSKIVKSNYSTRTQSRINWKKPFSPYSIGVESFGQLFNTKGDCFSFWVSYYSLKIKYSQANLIVPEFFLRDGFSKMFVDIKAINFELLGDEINLDEFWVGTGLMSFNGSLGIIDEEVRGNFELVRLAINAGYIKKLYHNLSINMWGGIYILIMGDKEFQVGGRTAYSDVFVPIISVDIGWHL
jgi:TolB-like protein